MLVWAEFVILATSTYGRLTEARLQLIFKQRAVHDVNIDISFFRMPKCAGQSADDLETELLPEMDRSRVRGNHEIELHGAKTDSTRLAQTVLGHSVSHSGTLGVSCDHEGGVGDVRPGTRLIWPQDISADNATIFFCDVSMSIGLKPISQRLLARHFRIKRVRVARGDDCMNDFPDRIVIRVRRRTYSNHLQFEIESNPIACRSSAINQARPRQQLRQVSVLHATALPCLGQNSVLHAARSHSIV